MSTTTKTIDTSNVGVIIRILTNDLGSYKSRRCNGLYINDLYQKAKKVVFGELQVINSP